MRGLGSGNVTSGPMRGLEKNCTRWHRQTDRQTHRRTWRLYDWPGPEGRVSEKDNAVIATAREVKSGDKVHFVWCLSPRRLNSWAGGGGPHTYLLTLHILHDLLKTFIPAKCGAPKNLANREAILLPFFTGGKTAATTMEIIPKCDGPRSDLSWHLARRPAAGAGLQWYEFLW